MINTSEIIKEEYSDKFISTNSIIPSFQVSDTIVEPYNAMFSIQYLLEYADNVLTTDNQSLNKINKEHFNKDQPTYKDFNYITQQLFSNICYSEKKLGNLREFVSKEDEFSINVFQKTNKYFLLMKHYIFKEFY